MKRAAVITAAAVMLVAAAPAAASELHSFELPSGLVDASRPAARSRTAARSRRSMSCCRTATAPTRSAAIPCSGSSMAPTAGRTPGFRASPRWPPASRRIMVMPDGGQFGMYMDWWNGGVRGAPAWATYHLQVLRQEIERRYPIRRGRRWHAIAGISMGGQGALRYAAMLPGYFGVRRRVLRRLPRHAIPDRAGRPEAARRRPTAAAARSTRRSSAPRRRRSPRATARRRWRPTTSTPAST